MRARAPGTLGPISQGRAKARPKQKARSAPLFSKTACGFNVVARLRRFLFGAELSLRPTVWPAVFLRAAAFPFCAFTFRCGRRLFRFGLSPGRSGCRPALRMSRTSAMASGMLKSWRTTRRCTSRCSRFTGMQGQHQPALHAQEVGQVVQRPAAPACKPRSCPPSTCRWAFRPRTAPQAETARCRRDCEFGDSAMESLSFRNRWRLRNGPAVHRRGRKTREPSCWFSLFRNVPDCPNYTRASRAGKGARGKMTSLAAPRHEEEGIRCRGFSSASIADANRCTTTNRPRPAHPSSITAP